MDFLTAEVVEELVTFPELIDTLHQAFLTAHVTPLRQHLDYRNPKEEVDSTLLLMPAWREGAFLGVKMVTVSPHNYKYDLPSIQGIYTLFDAHKGKPLLQMDAPILTNLRTAAASALASRFLSRKDSSTLLMVGTGALAPYLVRAHMAVRPVRRVLVWGRNFRKAQRLAQKLDYLNAEVAPVEQLSANIRQADIISCATLSQEPLLAGEVLVPGQHLDLVGSFKPNMREADDAAVRRASIFVDTIEGATKESGDLRQPLEEGVITPKGIKGTFQTMCRSGKGRTNQREITLFKSVGHASEDLAAAELIYKNWIAAG